MISLYGKHLCKTVKSKPLQPIIIILAVALAAAIFISALLFENITLQKLEAERVADFNNSDIRITISSQSEKKYFEYSDITTLVNDNDIVECSFSYLVNYININGTTLLIPILGVDFAHINQINKIDFADSKPITNQNKNDIVIVGESFAKDNKLRIDDEIDISIFGTVQRLVVAGIAKDNGYFLSHDIIISIDNFMQAVMAKSSMPITDTNTKYFNTAIIKLADASTKAQTIKNLQNSEAFTDKQVEDSGYINKDYVSSNIIINRLFISFVIICCTIVSIILMYTTYEIFTNNRLHAIALFKSQGATDRQMIWLLLSEVFVYSLLGSILGLALSSLLSKLIIASIDIASFGIVVPIKMFFYGLIYGVALPLACVLVPIIKTSNMQLGDMLSGATKKYKEPKLKLVIALLLALLIQIIVILMIPNKWRIYCIISILLTVILATIFLIPFATAFFSKILDFIWNKNKNKNLFNLALKNSKRNLSIQNANRIFCVAIIIIIVLLNCIGYLNDTISEQVEAIKFDYHATTLFMPSDLLYHDILAIEGVESVHIISINEKASLNNNISYAFIGYEGAIKELLPNIDYVGNGDEIKPGEVVISQALALINNNKVGDTITVTVNNISKPLKIVAILKTNTLFIIASASNYGLKYNQLLINENKDISEELSLAMNKKMTIITTKDANISRLMNSMNKFVNLAEAFVSIIVLITFIGTANCFLISLRARKNEFFILSNVGMKNKEKYLMLLMEFAINLIGMAVVIVSAVCILNFSIMQALKYFGINYKTIFI